MAWWVETRATSVRARVVAVLVGVAALVPVLGGQADAAGGPVFPENTPMAAWRADGVGYATLIVGTTVYVMQCCCQASGTPDAVHPSWVRSADDGDLVVSRQ